MNLRPFLRRLAPFAALVALLLGGCLKDRLAWSPDGSRAAILTQEGLQFCDVDGKLTPLLVPGAYRVAWLGDSQRLVIARSREIKDYAALAAALGPERTQALAAKAEVIWQHWRSGPKGELSSGFESDDDLGAVIVYLREHHGAALRAKIAEGEKANDDLKDLETMAATWHSLVVARLTGDRLETTTTLREGLVEIRDLRPAPGQPAVAFVIRPELNRVRDESVSIFVTLLDGSAPPTLVASHTALKPDWTPDGRTLVYLKAASEQTGGNLVLGALVEREVLDAAGHLQLAEKTRDLAGLIFQSENRVRCLPDGRVIFDAAEFHLPLAGKDLPSREQLFAIDRTKDDIALTPLLRPGQREKIPDHLASFEISPDGQQVLFHAGADVAVLTLATGNAERLSLNVFNDQQNKSPPFPVWRLPGELVYLKIGDPREELVLRRGAEEIVLSRTWSDELLEKLIK